MSQFPDFCLFFYASPFCEPAYTPTTLSLWCFFDAGCSAVGQIRKVFQPPWQIEGQTRPLLVSQLGAVLIDLLLSTAHTHPPQESIGGGAPFFFSCKNLYSSFFFLF